MSWNFAAELRKHGPESPPAATGGLSESFRYCEHVAKSHYENFTVASWLMPKHLRPHFHAVYAWCRWADDLGDETRNPRELLQWWREELFRCASGVPVHPVTIALQKTIHRYKLPEALFLDLISAFEQDQQIKEYSSFEQLRDYCRRSADPVGRIVLRLFECYSDPNAELSDYICSGLQLANFWQDVARDHAIGRIYIPREDRERFGYGDDDFVKHVENDAFRTLMQFEVRRAREFFDAGEPLLKQLPRQARIDVTLFLEGGRAVLEAIEKQNFNVWSRRPTVTKWQKFSLLAKTIAGM